jgi:hypothetical protein
MLSNIGHGGYRWRFVASPPWPISDNIAGFSAILRYDGAARKPEFWLSATFCHRIVLKLNINQSRIYMIVSIFNILEKPKKINSIMIGFIYCLQNPNLPM